MRKMGSLLLVALFVTPLLYAQGSGSMKGPQANYVVTKDVKGTIQQIDYEKKLVIVETEPQTLYQFALDDKKLKLKAEKKTQLATSKKKIELTDFVKGQTVRITYDPASPSRAKEIRLLEDAAAGSAASAGAAQ